MHDIEMNNVMNYFFLAEIQHLYGGALESAFAFVTLLIVTIRFTALGTQGEASDTFSRENFSDRVTR
jgi:hypothetical protein